jgi:hypothetical protein
MRYGQPLCLVQKCMPPALQQIQPPFMHDAVSVHGTKFGLPGH